MRNQSPPPRAHEKRGFLKGKDRRASLEGSQWRPVKESSNDKVQSFGHQQSTTKHKQCKFKAGVPRERSWFNMNFFRRCWFHFDRTSESWHFLNSTFKLPLNSILKFTQTSGNYLPNQLGSEEYCNFIFLFFCHVTLNLGFEKHWFHL